jgi:uncharacterized membrane protein required for colicin V production
MTPALWTDLVLLVLLAAGAIAGWRRGGLRLAGAVVGLLAGLVVAAAGHSPPRANRPGRHPGG